MLYLAAAFLPVLAVIANPVSPLAPRQSATSPPPDEITIIDASSSGNGCPQGSVTQSLSSDGTIVTFGFDDFQTYIGPEAAQDQATKQCQLHLTLQYPGGFQYSVVDAVYHGYAQLDPGVTGNFISTYYFSQDAADTCTTRSSISGAEWVDGDVYTKEDDVVTTALIWSPCGDTGILNVNNRIALTSTNSSASGSLSDDDATVAFTHQVHVSWQPCVLPTSATAGYSIGDGTTTVSGGKK